MSASCTRMLTLLLASIITYTPIVLSQPIEPRADGLDVWFHSERDCKGAGIGVQNSQKHLYYYMPNNPKDTMVSMRLNRPLANGEIVSTFGHSIAGVPDPPLGPGVPDNCKHLIGNFNGAYFSGTKCINFSKGSAGCFQITH